jgi:hypothetical protein
MIFLIKLTRQVIRDGGSISVKIYSHPPAKSKHRTTAHAVNRTAHYTHHMRTALETQTTLLLHYYYMMLLLLVQLLPLQLLLLLVPIQNQLPEALER